MTSQSLGLKPRTTVAAAIFSPCSSVLVMNITFFPNSLCHKIWTIKCLPFTSLLQVCNTKIVQQHIITTMHVFPDLLVEICYLCYMLLKIYIHTQFSNKTLKAIWIYSSLVKELSFYFVFTSSNNTWKIYKPIEGHIWSIKHTKRLFLVNGSCTEERKITFFHLWAYGSCYILEISSHL